jgi:isoquinoline 1-oxidoreductase beta subunit
MGVGAVARRTFLGLGVVAAGGVAVGYYYYRKPIENPLKDGLAEGEATFNPFVKIANTGEITVIAPRAEMGQGVSTTLAALVAEELDVRLDQIIVVHGPVSSAYYAAAAMEEVVPFASFDHSAAPNILRGLSKAGGKIAGLQVTGGSSSMVDLYLRMRLAGFAARSVIVEAAARRWNVPLAKVGAREGMVINEVTKERAPYGDFALDAAMIEPPADFRLRDPRLWKILGKPQRRTDIHSKVTGAPIFGVDVDLPGMLYGAVALSPRFGAIAKAIDSSAALGVPGAIKIVPLETISGNGVGVIADNTWAAFKAAEALEIEWSEVDYPQTTKAQFAALADTLEGDGWKLGGAGDVDAAFADPAGPVVEAEYRAPYLAHACMEPMNATAQIANGKLRLWTGTQAPSLAAILCAPLAGVSEQDVDITVTSLGGGFGRRLESDFAMFATLLAREADGRPVKLTYSREQDTRHDTYRPPALGRFRAVAKPGVGPEALEMRIATPNLAKALLSRVYPSIPLAGPDKLMLEGLFNQPYVIPNARYESVEASLGAPVGFWRSVGHSFNGFFHEAFFDEIAEAAGVDPMEMRIDLARGEEFSPARKALRKVAEMSDWGGPQPQGHGKGVAFTLSYGAWVAEVVEVVATPAGIRILNVWCAADLGRVLDPGIVEAQMMSGIIFGLSSAMMQEITLEDGAVVQSNFHDCDAMRMAQCPKIEVALLENAPKMGGAGEPGTPPSIPALANAIHAATGQRLRETPFSKFVDFA